MEGVTDRVMARAREVSALRSGRRRRGRAGALAGDEADLLQSAALQREQHVRDVDVRHAAVRVHVDLRLRVLGILDRDVVAEGLLVDGRAVPEDRAVELDVDLDDGGGSVGGFGLSRGRSILTACVITGIVMMKMISSTSMMSTSGMTFGSTIGSALSPLTETAMQSPAEPLSQGLDLWSTRVCPSIPDGASQRGPSVLSFLKNPPARKGGDIDDQSDRRHPKYRPGGPGRGGQDPAGRGASVRRRQHPRQGQPGPRHHGLRPRSPGATAAAFGRRHALLARDRRRARQPDRHARVSRISSAARCRCWRRWRRRPSS